MGGFDNAKPEFPFMVVLFIPSIDTSESLRYE